MRSLVFITDITSGDIITLMSGIIAVTECCGLLNTCGKTTLIREVILDDWGVDGTDGSDGWGFEWVDCGFFLMYGA